MPELALMRFVVENQGLITGNEFLGQYTLPVLCMNRGNIPKSKMIMLTIRTYIYQRPTLIHQIALPMTVRCKGNFMHGHIFSLRGLL